MTRTYDEEVLKMLKRVLDFAHEHGYCFHPRTNVFDKVSEIVNNGGGCICDPRRTECPCEHVHREVREKGWCLCRLFARYGACADYMITFDIRYGAPDGDGHAAEKKVGRSG